MLDTRNGSVPFPVGFLDKGRCSSVVGLLNTSLNALQ